MFIYGLICICIRCLFLVKSDLYHVIISRFSQVAKRLQLWLSTRMDTISSNKMISSLPFNIQMHAYRCLVPFIQRLRRVKLKGQDVSLRFFMGVAVMVFITMLHYNVPQSY